MFYLVIVDELQGKSLIWSLILNVLGDLDLLSLCHELCGGVNNRLEYSMRGCWFNPSFRHVYPEKDYPA